MYKYFISYMFGDKENHLGFGNTVCSSEKKITDLDAIIEIENNIKEVSIQQEMMNIQDIFIKIQKLQY